MTGDRDAVIDAVLARVLEAESSEREALEASAANVALAAEIRERR